MLFKLANDAIGEAWKLVVWGEGGSGLGKEEEGDGGWEGV